MLWLFWEAGVVPAKEPGGACSKLFKQAFAGHEDGSEDIHYSPYA